MSKLQSRQVRLGLPTGWSDEPFDELVDEHQCDDCGAGIGWCLVAYESEHGAEWEQPEWSPMYVVETEKSKRKYCEDCGMYRDPEIEM